MDYSKGDLIDHRYRLERPIGRGSFGEVWLACDTLTDVMLAVKIYVSLDNRGLRDFKLEFRNVRSLSHPNLLRPDQYAMHGASPYLVMTYCPGTLATRIEHMSERDMWKLIRDVASGLAYLHAHDIVHRDIKPDNILQNDEGAFVISDFGLSHQLRASMQRASGMGNSNPLCGTLAYMAPELFDTDAKAVKATDVWALGVALYEVATGELPFCGRGGNMLRSGSVVPSLPPGRYSGDLNDLVRRCMALEPWDRPMADEIRRIALQHLGMPEASPMASPKADDGKCKEQVKRLKNENDKLRRQLSGMKHTDGEKKPHTWSWIAALAAALVAMGVLAVLNGNLRRQNRMQEGELADSRVAMADVQRLVDNSLRGPGEALPSWTSSTRDAYTSSKTLIPFNARPGDALMFDYSVRDSYYGDCLTIVLVKPSGQKVTESQYSNGNGRFQRVLDEEGRYELEVKFDKGYGYDNGRGSIYNVELKRNVLYDIELIADDYLNAKQYEPEEEMEVEAVEVMIDTVEAIVEDEEAAKLEYKSTKIKINN